MGLSKLGQTLTAKEVLDLVKDELKLVEREIGLESVASVNAITAIGQYLHQSGGKRLRPILVLLSCKLVGKSSAAAIRMAAVMEMIHAATLIHDDVIDAARTRRGKPSINMVWGNQVSVLAGDWLYMQAFQVALRERNYHMLDVLIALTQAMVEGELLQLERLGKLDLGEADYMELVDRKTASLFSTCARLGVMVAGGDETVERKLGDFAWNLGMAFQLIDDILDFTAREKVLGKPVGNDLREGKVTLPVIYALKTTSSDERRLIETVIREQSYERAPFSVILDILRRCQGIDQARERAQQFAQRARALIMEFPDSPYQKALVAVTDLVTDRDH